MSRRRGRPTKLTAEVQEKICTAIRGGNFLETAAAFADVHRDTLHDWLRRGRRASKGPYHDFARAVEKAMADAETRCVALVTKAAAGGNWQAGAWWLERSRPQWSQRQRHEVTATVAAQVKVSSSDAVDQLLQLLGARQNDSIVGDAKSCSAEAPDAAEGTPKGGA